MMMFLPIAGQVPIFLAYLDPGSGSLLLQVLIAGLLSSLFFLKSSLIMMRSRFSRVFKNDA